MTSTLRLHEVTFRAFGSGCRVVCDVEEAEDLAISRLEDLEGRWSRFRDSSEVSEVNRNAGDWCEVSTITAQLFEAGVRAIELTNGVVNPLMLKQLQGLGYVASHEHLELSTAEPTHATSTSGRAETDIDVAGGLVRIPAGTGFDPGGIGKGLAADLVTEDLVDSGATWVMVSLGGDIRFAGTALANYAPVVHVDDPRTAGALLGATRVAGGALATSSTTSRRWAIDGQVHHHLLDPRTGAPTQSPRIAASVYAPNAWLADVLAKALVVNPDLGEADLTAWGAEAIAFTQTTVVDLGLPVEHITVSAA